MYIQNIFTNTGIHKFVTQYPTDFNLLSHHLLCQRPVFLRLDTICLLPLPNQHFVEFITKKHASLRPVYDVIFSFFLPIFFMFVPFNNFKINSIIV